MSALDDSIIAFLGRRYGGAVATRALWQWAGGQPAEIAFAEPTAHAWAELWSRVRKGNAVTPVAVLREALFDQPGDSETLELLAGLASEAAASARPDANRLAGALGPREKPVTSESLLEMAGALAPLEREIAFAAIAPAMQGRLNWEERSALSGQLAAVIGDPKAEAARALALALTDALEGTAGSSG